MSAARDSKTKCGSQNRGKRLRLTKSRETSAAHEIAEIQREASAARDSKTKCASRNRGKRVQLANLNPKGVLLGAAHAEKTADGTYISKYPSWFYYCTYPTSLIASHDPHTTPHTTLTLLPIVYVFLPGRQAKKL